jgi:hypothetical protein
MLIIILTILGILFLLYVIRWVMHYRQAGTIHDTKDRIHAQDELLKTVAQFIAGIALIATVILTWYQVRETIQGTRDQIELTRRGQLADRFKDAVQQLGSDQNTLRIGGIFTLEQISKESPNEYLTSTTLILTAYLRNELTLKAYESASTKREDWPSSAVKAALMVLGRREIRDENEFPNLSQVMLRKADLTDVGKLEQLRLDGADLSEANLSGINLTRVLLRGAKLAGTNLSNSNLSKADLSNADLSIRKNVPTDLFNATLNDAILESTKLTGARLSLAHMDRAILINADLTAARMLSTRLTDANPMEPI